MNKRNNVMRNTVKSLLLAALVSIPMHAGAGPTGQAISFTCAGCHGTDGSSVGPSMPAIAGMDPEVFFDAMKAYRDDGRNATIMNPSPQPDAAGISGPIC